MKLLPIHTGNFKLDGGAMFGVVPKVLWRKRMEADENNLCNWALRCLLIEDGNRLVLIDTGMGEKQSDKFFSYYFLSNTIALEEAIKAQGYHPSDVTDVFLTHMHFDHVGGAVKRVGEELVPTFKNAVYWSNEKHWDWASFPNPREKASFLKENFDPLLSAGQVQMIHPEERRDGLPFDILYMDGHTEKQMLPVLEYKGKKVVFMADLLPSTAHIPLPWVMGYDVRPLLTMSEKEQFLQRAAKEEWVLYFEHDAITECATVKATEKGVILDQTFSLNEI